MQPSVAQSGRWPARPVESAGLGTGQLWVVWPRSGGTCWWRSKGTTVRAGAANSLVFACMIFVWRLAKVAEVLSAVANFRLTFHLLCPSHLDAGMLQLRPRGTSSGTALDESLLPLMPLVSSRYVGLGTLACLSPLFYNYSHSGGHLGE
ncbi:hypothetical protein F2Q69_00028903 [Brassica cretica]|uniref:Uncharacterized protein n=1 Tax=Brassica cretica TaxID=69181 RepID=A0A8S9S215_BRACR|nr:hypothetical protein F2Q69_00028903 [Brassica cretica]